MDAVPSMLEYIVRGAASAVLPMNLLVMFIGLVVGIVGGMLPGITTVTAVALFVPFTFSMPPDMALIGLGGVFCGAMYGGANAAILINTPGTPGSIATSLDGYPLVMQGRAEEACYIALIASVLGGIFGTVVLMLFFEPLSVMALKFGSEAFFWMGLFGLSTLAAMFPGNIAKGLLGGAIGLALCTVGLDPVMGMPRFTFGCFDLVQGLDMVALMIGLFSLSQMFVMLESDEKYIVKMERQAHAFKLAVTDILRHLKLLSVASAIGTFIGALPGAGGSVAALVSYNEAKRWDKAPDRYGKGAVEGILVPESANNASVGGSLVPLLSLGIPGSAAAAVLAGGLMAQGLTPGPQLMEKNPEIAYAFIVSMIIANIGMLLIGYLLVRVCTRILDVPKLLIIPAVISISFLGAYALRNSMFDVLLMILSGGIAYLLLKAKIMPAGIALSSLRPSGACLRRYDFWVVLAITVGGAVLLRQSYAIEGISGYFPQAVYASIVGLGIFIMLMQIFSGTARKPETVRPGCYWSICLYLGLMGVGYLLIEPLGFYAATFLCIVAMTAYGTFWLSGRKADLRGIGSVLAYSLLLIAVEYGCFSLIMEVQTPTGLLF